MDYYIDATIRPKVKNDSSLIKLIVSVFTVFYTSQLYAMSNKEAGDIGRYAIPLASASATLLQQDYQGLTQLALSMALVQGSTEGLKTLTRERRPNGGCCASFPSGHVSSASTGAAFIQFRYGWQYSLPFYLGAAYVAYSRVNVKAHYVHDVLAGAALGIAGTYLSTTAFKTNSLQVVVDKKYAGITYRQIF